MGAQEIEASVLESLAAKIDGLDLSEPEALILEHVLARAAAGVDAEAEVEGFGVVYGLEPTFVAPAAGVQLSDRAAGLGRAMGFNTVAAPQKYIGETEKNLHR